MSRAFFCSHLLGCVVALLAASVAAPRGACAELRGAVAASNTNAAVAAPLPPKSPNVTINLIRRLVERGVLTAQDAEELIRQAEADAAEARAAAAAAAGGQSSPVAADATERVAPQPSNVTPAPATSTNVVRVPYVPEIVKLQIRDEVKAELMAEARAGRLGLSNAVPGWVSRFSVKGDVRVRYEGMYFPEGNDNTGVFPNFNAINTGPPFDITGTVFSPQRNVDQDRERLRLRVRAGAEANLGDGFTAGLRLATGDSSSPVSQNQSLGASGGNFSKYAIWLDRGFIKYELGGQPSRNLGLVVGRFDNPFFSPSEILWDADLGFDGVALQGRQRLTDRLTLFGAGGVFPVYNTDLNFSSNRPDKYPSTDKWLYSGQLGVDWSVHKDWSVRLAAAYHYFDGVEGRLSDPYLPLTAQDQSNTDGTRPSFAQYGNTYMMLRNIIPAPENNYGTINQWQYFGLATPFENAVLSARLDYKHFEPFIVSLLGEYAQNVAYDGDRLRALAVNNLDTVTGNYVGGDTAWLVGLRVGSAALQKRWDWYVTADYRRVETDAVIDGFCDSDFGGGGTNVKGWSLSGALALSPRVSLGVRWMSSDEVSGPTLKLDIFQADITARF